MNRPRDPEDVAALEPLKGETRRKVALMNEAGGDIGAKGHVEFDRGFDGRWRRRVRLGLTPTLAPRLRWLEQTVEELRPLVGRAHVAKAFPER